MEGYTIRCSGHNYITLEYNDKFIICFDNDMEYAEEIIYRIQKRTGMKFQDIQIKGSRDDFSGLRFFNGGWKRDFWKEFPEENELNAFININKGKIQGGIK